MPAQPDAEAVPMDVTKMTKVQKLAALLIVIGPEAASQVMKNLDEHELDIIAAGRATKNLKIYLNQGAR